MAFSCKKRGFCPSCDARRMAESARHLVEELFGPRPVRQWVLSFPYLLRFLFASKPDAIGPVLGIVHRVIAGWLADQAGIDRASAQYGAVTLILRFGSALTCCGSTACTRTPNIDVSTCALCGGAVRIVASIEAPAAIRAILAHFENYGALEQAHYRPAARAPPAAAA